MAVVDRLSFQAERVPFHTAIPWGSKQNWSSQSAGEAKTTAEVLDSSPSLREEPMHSGACLNLSTRKAEVGG